MSKKIVLTGGGTAGHITPNIALLPRLSQLGYEISYIGSYNGMEKKLIEDYDIPYYGWLLYTSDAAHERTSVELGGRRVYKKTK